jgi:hypothetical protein
MNILEIGKSRLMQEVEDLSPTEKEILLSAIASDFILANESAFQLDFGGDAGDEEGYDAYSTFMEYCHVNCKPVVAIGKQNVDEEKLHVSILLDVTTTGFRFTREGLKSIIDLLLDYKCDWIRISAPYYDVQAVVKQIFAEELAEKLYEAGCSPNLLVSPDIK